MSVAVESSVAWVNFLGQAVSHFRKQVTSSHFTFGVSSTSRVWVCGPPSLSSLVFDQPLSVFECQKPAEGLVPLKGF
jgi:hypothetical protein